MVFADNNTVFKYEKNDVVVIHKPDNIEESPTWVPCFMDEFDGMICHIKSAHINPDLIYYTVAEDECCFAFNEKWLEPYEEDITATDIYSLFE